MSFIEKKVIILIVLLIESTKRHLLSKNYESTKLQKRSLFTFSFSGHLLGLGVKFLGMFYVMVLFSRAKDEKDPQEKSNLRTTEKVS